MDTLDLDIARVRALHGIVCAFTRLKWLRDATRFELAMHRHAIALKYGYNPSQPRVPKGEEGAGEWTDANGNLVSSDRTRLAGKIPTSGLPKKPQNRPMISAERTAAKKEIARDIAEFGLGALGFNKFGKWAGEFRAEIISYNDAPRALQELQQRALAPVPGYVVHHIVERNQEDYFAKEVINGPDNLALVPRMKHQEINSWYQTKNPDFGGESPREYLNGRSWAVQRSVGLEALRRVGVLKP
jgi:hypothetical protein